MPKLLSYSRVEIQMKKFYLNSVLVLILLSAGASAQTGNCRLTAAEAPILHNFRLGMTSPEARAATGGKLKIKIKREGSFFQNFIEKAPPAFLADVRALYLRFYDGRLYQIEVFYHPANSLSAIIEKNVVGANLPFADWTTQNGASKINCAGFSIVADERLNPHIELTDENQRALFEASQKK